jgi:hypothetical protein
MDPDDVIMTLYQAERDLNDVLGRKWKEDGSLTLFVQILGQKICGQSALDSSRNTLVSRICTPTFLAQIQELTFALASEAANGISVNS